MSASVPTRRFGKPRRGCDGQLVDRDFAWVADIECQSYALRRIHRGDSAAHGIAYVCERARLFTVAVNRDRAAG